MPAGAEGQDHHQPAVDHRAGDERARRHRPRHRNPKLGASPAHGGRVARRHIRGVRAVAGGNVPGEARGAGRAGEDGGEVGAELGEDAGGHLQLARVNCFRLKVLLDCLNYLCFFF